MGSDARRELLRRFGKEGCDTGPVVFRECPSGMGSGGFASRDISAGDVLITLPRHLSLTERLCMESKIGTTLIPIISDQENIEPGWFCMLIVLVALRFDPRYAKCAETEMDREDIRSIEDPLFDPSFAFFAPYVHAIPSRFTDPLHWSENEREFLLKGTNILQAVEMLEETLKSQYDLVMRTAIQKHANLYPAQHYSFQNFLWARSAFSSRAFIQFDAQSPEKPELNIQKMKSAMMLPVWDLINHRMRERVEWKFEEDSSGAGAFILRTLADIKEGNEIFNNYGAKGNEELLLNYGFCIDQLECDTVALMLGIRSDDQNDEEQDETAAEKNRKITDIMTKSGLSFRQYLYRLKVFDSTIAPESEDFDSVLPKSLFSVMRLLTADLGLLNIVERKLNGMDKFGILSTPVNATNEMMILKCLLALFQTRLSLISGGSQEIEGDNAMDSTINEHHRQLAIIYRNGQMELLSLALNEILRLQSKYICKLSITQVFNGKKTGSDNTKEIIEMLQKDGCVINADYEVEANCLKSTVKLDDPRPIIALEKDHIITAKSIESMENEFSDALSQRDIDLDETVIIQFYLMWALSNTHAIPLFLKLFLETVQNQDLGVDKWKDEEIDLLVLPGDEQTSFSQWKSRISEFRGSLKEAFYSCMPSLTASSGLFRRSDTFNFERFSWSAHVLLRYGLDIDFVTDECEGPTTTLVLIPIPYFATHHACPSMHVCSNVDGGVFFLPLGNHIDKGDILSISLPGMSQNTNVDQIIATGNLTSNNPSESVIIVIEEEMEQKLALDDYLFPIPTIYTLSDGSCVPNQQSFLLQISPIMQAVERNHQWQSKQRNSDENSTSAQVASSNLDFINILMEKLERLHRQWTLVQESRLESASTSSNMLVNFFWKDRLTLLKSIQNMLFLIYSGKELEHFVF